MIFGREPATIAALVKAAIALAALTFIPLTDNQQTVLNAAAATLLGFIVAWRVAADKALPLVVGLIEAVVYVAIEFGFNIDQAKQAAILALGAAIVGVVTRDRVDAPVDINGRAR